MEVDYINTGLWTLIAATFILATSHTVSPDHWFPFVMVGRANKWKLSWVLGLAILAGIGHVGTSVIIGLVGVLAKKGTAKEIATFLECATPLLLMIFGFAYAAYAFYKQMIGNHGHSHGIPILNRWLGIDPHTYELSASGHCYPHAHHDHEHQHNSHGHIHTHHNHSTAEIDLRDKKAGWGLVAILGLTPCIALLPLTFAAVKYGTVAIILVNVCFAIATIGTIVLFSWLGLMGLSWIKFEFFDRYGGVTAGIVIGLLGIVTKVFEL
jgi:ABC-type nickel/cobalt efflux system permease component RcnA